MRDPPASDGLTPHRETAVRMRFAGLVLDLDARTLARESGEAIPLTRGEFAILRMFITRQGRVLSRDTLLDALANRRFEAFDRSVDVLVARLRRKIERDPKHPRLIVTVQGEGYRFDGLTKPFAADEKSLIGTSAIPDDKPRTEQEAQSSAQSERRLEREVAGAGRKPADATSVSGPTPAVAAEPAAPQSRPESVRLAWAVAAASACAA